MVGAFQQVLVGTVGCWQSQSDCSATKYDVTLYYCHGNWEAALRLSTTWECNEDEASGSQSSELDGWANQVHYPDQPTGRYV